MIEEILGCGLAPFLRGVANSYGMTYHADESTIGKELLKKSRSNQSRWRLFKHYGARGIPMMPPFVEELLSRFCRGQGMIFVHWSVRMKGKHPRSTQHFRSGKDGLEVLSFVLWNPGIAKA